VRFDSAHKVHLDPIMPVLSAAVLHVKPAHKASSRKAGTYLRQNFLRLI
jgi:hypothetical protein